MKNVGNTILYEGIFRTRMCAISTKSIGKSLSCNSCFPLICMEDDHYAYMLFPAAVTGGQTSESEETFISRQPPIVKGS